MQNEKSVSLVLMGRIYWFNNQFTCLWFVENGQDAKVSLSSFVCGEFWGLFCCKLSATIYDMEVLRRTTTTLKLPYYETLRLCKSNCWTRM